MRSPFRLAKAECRSLSYLCQVLCLIRNARMRQGDILYRESVPFNNNVAGLHQWQISHPWLFQPANDLNIELTDLLAQGITVNSQ